MTTTAPAHADAPTVQFARADGYRRPGAAILVELVDELRAAGGKRRAASAKWAARDAKIKARWRLSWKVRIAKRDDTELSDCWSEYTYWRDEGMALSAEIQAECAALAALRGAR